MSLRWKIALAMAAIASIATIAIAAASYRETSERLLAEVDRSLLDLDGFVNDRRLRNGPLPERGPLSALDAQIVDRAGDVVQSTFAEPVPLSDAARSVVGRPRTSVFDTIDTADGSYRVRTVGIQRGAVQVGRSLEETDRVLRSLRVRSLLWVVLVVAAAISAGLWIASRVTASLRRLTDAAEHVGATGRLDISVDEGRDDEVGRLGVAFDRMLTALGAIEGRSASPRPGRRT